MSTYPDAPMGDRTPYQQGVYQQSTPSNRSFIATWLFAWLLGFLGVDRFYLGKVGTGIVKLLTIGGLGIWWLIDLILTLAGVQRDKEGRLLPDYQEHKLIAWIVTAAGTALWIFISAITRLFAFVPEQLGPMTPWWNG
ncbi:TM2 domain-containing protein [Ruicaihuangia caeni]|uniref:TM2 domain-containing protein n=1 Tax=Ruicaihuangia caeni TaxID=3042517 RepID=UPI00338DAE5D